MHNLIRHPVPYLKGLILKSITPIFFNSIGSGVLFFGRTKLNNGHGMVKIGKNSIIGDGVTFGTSRNSTIEIGENTVINIGTVIVSGSIIKIGTNVAIAEYVSIRDSEHKFSPQTGVYNQGYNVDPVEIGDNCWIGRGVYIGPGVKIGRGCIVGANSVVKSGTFPPASLIVGTPAVVKRFLK